MPCEVVAVGLACYDHLVRVPSFRAAAEGCRVRRVSVQGGGVAATAAAAAARLGARTALYCRLGDDFFGRVARDQLSAAGVELPVPPIPGAQSPVSTVLVEEESGERRFLYFPGRGLEAPVPPLEEPLRDARVLLVDGRWEEASLAAARLAVRLRVPVVTDIGHLRPHEEEILRLADYPIFSQLILGELGVYPPEREALAGRILAEGRARCVVFTLGEEGCEVHRRNREVRQYPAFPVEVEDTTGAGDAFHGAFAFAVARGWDFERSLRLALAVGALSCRSFGGRAGLPGLEEALRLLEGTR